MTIYYQESRISTIAFAKTESDLSEIRNVNLNGNENSEFMINPKFDSDLLSKISDLEQQKSKLTNQVQEIHQLYISPNQFPISSNKIESEMKNSKSTEPSEEMKQLLITLQLKLKEVSSELSECRKQLYSLADDELINNILPSISSLENIKTIIINAESPIFHDIEFSIDSDKVEINSKSVHQEPLSGISLGNSVMLDSLADQHFAILPGRQSSNIKSNLNQNHECIDAIAANGLMSSPKIMSEYSIGKIINEISKNKKLKDLNIYIIHSALKSKLLSYPGISKDYNIPCYAVGRGEILSVFFRYLAITFFPYMTVYDSVKNADYKYDI